MAVPKFAENQSKASEAELQYKSPLNFNEERFKGGMEQSTASMAATQETPWNLLPMNVGADKGSRSSTASTAPLSQAPEHGWESHSAPCSTRDIRQSK